MIIGIDLDNTLVNLNDFWIRKVSKELGYNFTGKDHTRWSFDNYPQDFIKRTFELMVDPFFMGNLPIIDGAFGKLLEWKEAGHTLIVITSRCKELEEVTCNFIIREFSQINKTFVLGVDNDKEDILVKEKINVIVDDNPMCIKSAIKLGIKHIFMISNIDTGYNHPYIEEYKKQGVKTVSSIKEINI
jgi:5'(3')-deoxyribonucleotidase